MYRRTTWDDASLDEALQQYADASTAAGMTRNAVHSYWDYARRFLAWRKGEYAPRGHGLPSMRPGAATTSLSGLEADSGRYEETLRAAGLSEAAIFTYVSHARQFVRYAAGDFEPGARLRGRRR